MEIPPQESLGKRFGRLIVMQVLGVSSDHRMRVFCICDCGTEKVIKLNSLRTNETKSCGCLRREMATQGSVTHGQHGTPEYQSWRGMLDRCRNKNHTSFANYGGRGISVCPEWSNSFESFLSSMGNRPTGTTLDRIHNDGNYEPGNCQWASNEKQAMNTRRAKLLVFNGEIKTISQWSRDSGIQRRTIGMRLKHGWSIERTLTEPVMAGGRPHP